MKTTSLTKKILICTLAGLTAGATFLRIGNRFLNFILPLNIVFIIAILFLIGAVSYSFLWHQRDKNSTINNDITKDFWEGIIRYSVAIDLSMFGFQKIFHLQFLTPIGMLEEPFNSFSGEWLTWSYFGHSYPFVVTIGLLQIIGSFLLVFKRTRLLGVITIMPILLNIILIDFFYDLALGVLAHAIVMMASATYILFLDYDRLVIFFLKFDYHERHTIIANNIVKNMIRTSILYMPVLLIAINKSPNEHPQLTGKYRVTKLTSNHVSIANQSPACQDSVLTTVYFDLGNDCVFEFNHIKRRLYGIYALDNKNQLTVNWHFPPSGKDNKFSGRIIAITDSTVNITGEMNSNPITMQLKKQL